MLSALKKALIKIIALITYHVLPPEVMKDKRFFCLWEKKGFHITPVHFYSPIPEVCSLPTDSWTRKTQLVGIDLNELKQIELLTVFSNYRSEYEQFPRDKPSDASTYYINNGMFPSIDGEILYCMIRYFKPRRIMEVGSGYTTLLSAQAILKNKQDDPSYDCELIAVEPYPSVFLEKGFQGLSKLISKRVQDIDLSDFESLETDDILFIDSSHVLKIGSDVQYLYLEVLPRLKKGVIVHCHDIFLPAEYPRAWATEENRFWSEQYILQSFLSLNESFQVLWAGQFMHLEHPDLLENFSNSYNRNTENTPGSFWFRRIK